MTAYFPLTTPTFVATVPASFARNWEIFVRPRGGGEGETVTVYAEGKDGAAILPQPLITGPAGRIGSGDEFAWVKGADLPLDVWGRPKGSSAAWQVLPEGDQAIAAGGAAVGIAESALAAGGSALETAESALLATTSIGRHVLRMLFEGLEDIRVLIAGDSTSQDYTGWVGKWYDGLAEAFPAVTFKYDKWDTSTNAYPAPETKHVGTGPRTITLYNCAVAQKNSWFQMTPYFDPMIAQVNPHLVIFSHGHNHGSAIYTPEPYFRDAITVATQEITRACPLAELVLFAQNPRLDANAEVQAKRQHVVEQLALLRGYGFVNLWRLFYEEGRNPADFLEPEGVHPNQAGYTLIAKRVLERMLLNGRLASQQPSSLLTPASSYLTNGDFASFAAPPTLPGWTAVNATLSKDTVNYESPNGYAVKISNVESNAGYMWQPISGDALRSLRGGWVTFAARVRVPAAQEVPEAGRLSIIEAGGSNPGNQPSDNLTIPGNGQGGFRWNMVSRRLAADCTSAQFYVLCSSAGTTAEVSVDRVTVARGVLPKDIRA